MATSSEHQPLCPSPHENGENHQDADPQSALQEPIAERSPPKAAHRSCRLMVLLVVSNILWALTMLVLLSAFWSTIWPPRQPEPRFATDLPDAQRAVRYVQREYSQALVYNQSSRQVERLVDPEEPPYFGDPSPEIDAAWARLLHGEFPVMTPDEAAPFVPELATFPDGNFHFELQVTHELHCLNTVRMHLSPEYYEKSKHAASQKAVPYSSHRDHLDHCLNILLQSIFCHSDLTPVPMYRWSGVSFALGRGATHTCRDFSAVREWYDERNVDGSAYTEFTGV